MRVLRLKIVCVMTALALLAPLALAQQAPDALATALDLRPAQAPPQAATGPADPGASMPAPVLADDAAAGAAGVMIGAVSVAGGDRLDARELSAAYEPYIGQEASSDSLRSLARSVADLARRQGYLFASAQVPAQAVRLGVVRVDLDLGAVDEVRIVGSENPRLRQILQGVVGPAPRREAVERRLLLAGDLPGVKIRNTRYERSSGRGVLIVETELRPISWEVSADSYGPETLGPWRAGAMVEADGLQRGAGALSLQALNSVDQPRELTWIGGRYVRTSADGATQSGVAISSGRARPGGALRRYDLESENLYAAVFASHALQRTRASSVWLNGEVAHVQAEQTVARAPLLEDAVTTATIGLSGSRALGAARLDGGLSVTRGLALSGDTRRGDPRASRSDGGGVFTRANAWTSFWTPVGQQYSLKLAALAQIASRALLASQEITLGGPMFGRAYDYAERFGDDGAMASIELRRHFGKLAGLLRDAHVYGYADAGRVTNQSGGFGGGSLSSAGVGLRGQVGHAQVSAELAAPLGADRFASGDRSPRLNVGLRLKF